MRMHILSVGAFEFPTANNGVDFHTCNEVGPRRLRSLLLSVAHLFLRPIIILWNHLKYIWVHSVRYNNKLLLWELYTWHVLYAVSHNLYNSLVTTHITKCVALPSHQTTLTQNEMAKRQQSIFSITYWALYRKMSSLTNSPVNRIFSSVLPTYGYSICDFTYILVMWRSTLCKLTNTLYKVFVIIACYQLLTN